jgi:cell division initiation protein
MALKPLDVRKQEFATRFRGLDPDEVRVFLDLVADELEGLSEEKAQLLSTVTSLESQIGEFRSIEESLRNALVLAERVSADAEARAKEREALLLREAELKAAALVGEADRRKQELVFQVAQIANQRKLFLARFRALLEGEMKALALLEEEAARETR